MAMRKNPQAAKAVTKEAVGARLRALRKRNGFTLKQLSKASGVPLSTLSKMELGQASLGYDKLLAIAAALGIDMSLLMQARDQALPTGSLSGRAVKVDSVDHEEYASENYRHKFLFNEVGGKVMTPILATVLSRTSTEFSEFIKHPGQEFVFVLAGSVRIVFESGDTIDLKKNEAAYFDSSIGHVYLSSSNAPARVLAVCSAHHGEDLMIENAYPTSSLD